jgi:S-DNA-T family DNA segregation ATPase FtsK/SpoIIIE
MSPRVKKDTLKKNRILGLLLIICGLLIAISLITHSQVNDSEILIKAFSGDDLMSLFSNPLSNRGGVIGVFIAYSLLSVFGYLALFIPLGVWAISYCFLFTNRFLPVLRRIGYIAMFLYFVGLLFSLSSAKAEFVSTSPGLGGLIGHVGAKVLTVLTGTVISYTIAISLILGTIIWVLPSGMSLPGQKFLMGLVNIKDKFLTGVKSITLKKKKTTSSKIKSELKEESQEESHPGLISRIIRIKKPKSKKTRIIEQMPEQLPLPVGDDNINYEADDEFDDNSDGLGGDGKLSPGQPRRSKVAAGTCTSGYTYPPADLLSDPPEDEPNISRQELESTAEALKDTLSTFGVRLANGEVEIYPGPIITRFEFKPAPGVKISQIVNLADDLALAMKAKRIRIVAPIPGKSAVGVEIPNRLSRTVYIKEIVTSDTFKTSKLMLPLALGKTISGHAFVVDLAAMPHLLIAGATGTGKSVCLNCIITSLLYKLSPEILRFILIDPKMLELSVYNDLPHLEKPVVTEMKYAEKVLTEAVVEMEDRYRKLAKVGVRNIADYNATADKPIPYVVIIVDELADLMMIGSNRVETLITRLAQMARAVGIHLILATQRPSVDVITGLIKANFSTRIAFQVATKVDSRTILDLNGAEKLLGRGDMLYMNPAFPEPKRVHGAFISGKETQSICKELGAQEYEPERIKNFDGDENKSVQYDPAADAVYREAMKLVVKHKQGSVSLLQRRLGIGYQRAARLIDMLEQNGIVGPYDGSKAREVLVDEEYLEEVFKGDQ